jgi:hypothetical protein
MKTSVSEAARVLKVSDRTLQRWVKEKRIPAPTPGIVDGFLSKYWTEGEMGLLRKYRDEFYWGKGIDRRTGKRAKQRKK